VSKTQIHVPDVGSSDPVDIIEISVKVGDTISAEDTIIVLESDKATVEVPAPQGGKVAAISVKVGDRVKEGDALMELEAEEGENGGQGDEGATASSSEPADSKGSKTEKNDAEQASNEKASPDDAPSGGKDDNARDENTDKQTGGSTETVKVPDLGDIDAAEIIEVNVSVGDELDEEQVIVVVESDKASLEIPSPKAGKVESVSVSVGDKVGTGDALITLVVAGGSASAEAEQAESDSDKGDDAEGVKNGEKETDSGCCRWFSPGLGRSRAGRI